MYSHSGSDPARRRGRDPGRPRGGPPAADVPRRGAPRAPRRRRPLVRRHEAARPLRPRAGPPLPRPPERCGRRRGVARALMERLLADARAIGYDRIRLGTLEEMTAARALYRALGFMEIPRYREEELVDTVFFECHLADRRSCFASAPHSGEEP